ncbi:BlaI/MecI/CopY family transcriptional regulator [Enteractinococcus helveticum]|uniref:Transcriptional regulator n=1 Tax=Enteractinococcus helveticum TaxID=1837282 RepID=A0A1B7M1D8_9MICC|nr:BlaI/MecI/CopY family transcriptional regulator [Enteractinococcus helveticum]OAV62413.1 hypothetical protein A6F49_06805 [Enteractinococcus helveticum]
MTTARNHPAPQLGELEQQVMNLLWDSSPRSVRDVMDVLPSNPAYTTIATVMQNLKTKHMVRSERKGRFVHYLPQLSREEYVARQMHQALDSSQDKAASILHFVQDMPEEGLQMLRNYLEQS